MGARHVSRAASAPFVVTEMDAQPPERCSLAIHGIREFAARVAFADLAGRQTSWTGDRREFLGRHGALGQPAALSGRLGPSPTRWRRARSLLRAADVDRRSSRTNASRSSSCSAKPRAQQSARAGAHAYRDADLDAVLIGVKDFWKETGSARFEVKTPDRSMDLMLNGWLLLSDAGLPYLGSFGVLPGQRRLRVP